VENLEKDKEKTAHLLDGQKAQIETLKKELEEWAEKWRQYEQKEFDMERELSATKDQLASKRSECERYIFCLFDTIFLLMIAECIQIMGNYGPEELEKVWNVKLDRCTELDQSQVIVGLKFEVGSLLIWMHEVGEAFSLYHQMTEFVAGRQREKIAWIGN